MSDDLLFEGEGAYPTEYALGRLREWPTTDLRGAFEFARGLWRYPDYFSSEGRVYSISTGGWSGNESVIGAMQDNLMLWTLCWQESRRGGHYKFEVPVNFWKEAP